MAEPPTREAAMSAEMAREGWVQASLQPVIATPIRTSNALANTMRVIAVTQHLRQAPRE